MSQCVTTGALCTCSFGDTPAALTADPVRPAAGFNAPLVTMDMIVPKANIASFGMCSAPNNPAVQSATSAAGGTPTPAPCVPAVLMPWMAPSQSVIAGGVPAILATSRCACSWLGEISVAEVPPNNWAAS